MWFGSDGDHVGAGGNACERNGQGGHAMFGDWRLDESMVEEFEDQIIPTRSSKQVPIYFKACNSRAGKCADATASTAFCLTQKQISPSEPC